MAAQSNAPDLAQKAANEDATHGRMFHLDALRAFCMFFGVFVHGSTIDYSPDLVFEAVREASSLFRMATFFLIGGFFTVMVYRRSTISEFSTSRMRLLVLPLVMSLILVVPITNWLNYCWHNVPVTLPRYIFEFNDLDPPLGKVSWNAHMWFLISMILYAFLTPLLVGIIDTPTVRSALDCFHVRTSGWTLWALSLIVAFLVVGLRVGYFFVLKPIFETTPFAWIVQASISYLPYFMLGGAAWMDRRLFSELHRFSPVGFLLIGGGYVGVSLWGDGLPTALETITELMLRVMLTVFIISGLMWAFHRWLNKPRPILTFAVDAAFSFYIFHLGIVFLTAQMLRPLELSMHGTYLCVVILVPLFTLSLHAFVIKPFPFMRLLFNGKRLSRQQGRQSVEKNA